MRQRAKGTAELLPAPKNIIRGSPSSSFGICNARAFRVRLSRARPPAQAQVNAAVRGLANCHNSPGILLRDRAVCGIKLPRDVLLATCRCRLGSAPADGF
mmetsp:Transcript_19124/g.72263  ORF Transcript_19124/g.72263 Transcript_19124/m.72263 type:complete len:100 (+) Transcript_19124:678-977(+)